MHIIDYVTVNTSGILIFEFIIVLVTIFIRMKTAFFNKVFLWVFVTLSFTS